MQIRICMSGQKIKLEKIGVLFLDNDKKVQFLPDQHTNYLIDSFGMTALHAPVIKREEVVNIQEPAPLDNVRKLKPVSTVHNNFKTQMAFVGSGSCSSCAYYSVYGATGFG
jgi:hypothetical protein